MIHGHDISNNNTKHGEQGIPFPIPLMSTAACAPDTTA
jgi:hypothetical protein